MFEPVGECFCQNFVVSIKECNWAPVLKLSAVSLFQKESDNSALLCKVSLLIGVTVDVSQFGSEQGPKVFVEICQKSI